MGDSEQPTGTVTGADAGPALPGPPPPSVPPPSGRTPFLRPAVFSWALYDFGSSAFNTLMVTFIFNLYFANVIVGDNITGTILWTRLLNISAVVVALLMPVLGAIADYSGRKKLLLVMSALQAILFTALLFFIGPGQAMAGAILFVVANIGFEAGNVFYNAFLPEVSTPRTIGRISGFGYFLGYMGGLICLALGLGMVRAWVPEQSDLNVRSTILLVAGWFLVFALPMFLVVKEKAVRRQAPLGVYVREGFHRIAVTIRHIRELREAAKLLIARMIYNDGLVTVIGTASLYANQVLGMQLEQVLVTAILLNVAAGIGAFGFGFVDDKIGGKRTLIITLLGLIVAGVVGVTITTIAGFWVAASLIGIMMGPNQSASRSLLAKLVPDHKHAEVFGLYAFSGKMSSLLGPLAYGGVLSLTSNHRLAMATILAFFGIGLVLLLFVREREGIQLATRLNESFTPPAA